MTIKASGRAALVIAAGLWICATGPSQAADDADSAAKPVVKHIVHHAKKSAQHESSKEADKSSDSRKTADHGDSPALAASQLPASIANANAQLAADTPASKDAKAMTERANNIVQATPDNQATPDQQATPATQAAPDSAATGQPASGSPVVASDQLNDLDRAVAASPAQGEAAAAPADAQQARSDNPPAAVVVAASSGDSTWDQTSIIGKVFIGFGALLTLASAARMFIA